MFLNDIYSVPFPGMHILMFYRLFVLIKFYYVHLIGFQKVPSL